MLRNFLFRIIILLFCIIGFPIYITTVVIYWLFAIGTFCILVFPAWLIFGKQGFNMLCKYLDLETYRKLFDLEQHYDANITVMWFCDIFDYLREKYNNTKCKQFI